MLINVGKIKIQMRFYKFWVAKTQLAL